MKKLLLLFSLWPFFLWGQVFIDFENGLPASAVQFPADRWDVNSESPLNGAYSLKHSYDNDASSCDRISFHHDVTDLSKSITWEFIIQYPYNPSSSNNWAVFLLSEKSAEFMTDDSENRALIFGVNYNGSDDFLNLYLQDGKHVELLCKTTFNWGEMAGADPWKFRISYHPDTPLVIETCRADTEFSVIGQVDMNGGILPVSEYSGLMYAYTSSKDRLLTFDDLKISGTFTRDTIPPEYGSVYFQSRNDLEFRFNELVFPGPDFRMMISGNLTHDTLEFRENSIIAHFAEEFVNDRTYPFTMKDIVDRKGNVTAFSDSFTFFLPVRYDLIFSEIMADPSPPVYLPESEYLEIFNRSSHDVNLQDWTITAGNRKFVLGGKVIGGGGYHLICDESAGWLYPSGLCSPAFTSSSVLTNAGQLVVLRNRQGEIIDALKYSDTWYDYAFKSQGGWSLERVDNDYLCGSTPNWKASEALDGGTPGLPNSVAGETTDNDDPFIESVICDSSGYFRLVFSEPVYFPADATARILTPLSLNDPDLTSVLSELFHDTLSVVLPPETDNGPFPVRFGSEFYDCSGNSSFPRDTFLLGIPARTALTDIIITEVLYSPFPGCAEFVELYNRSAKILSLGDLSLIVKGDDSADGIEGVFLSDDDLLFYPGCYIVLSPDPESLTYFYEVPDRRTLFRLPGIHALGNNGGTVKLTNRSGTVIDEMHYGPDDQYALLTDDHGISLERMTLDSETGLTAPWHSASSLSGFATPGYRNSQYLGTLPASTSFSADRDIFSPDNDGIDDVAVFRFHLDREGYIGTFLIFDASGRIVRTLGVNELLGPDGMFTWDGRDDGGRLCVIGIYLGYFEVYHLSGRKKSYKQTVVLAKHRY